MTIMIDEMSCFSSNTNFKGIIFDLDGTLVNSLQDLGESVNKVLAEYGFPTHSLEAYKFFVGNGIAKLIERALPAEHLAMQAAVLARFKEIYLMHQLDHTAPYSGIIELLHQLRNKGMLIGICTNKHEGAATEIIHKLFPDFQFDYIVGDRPDMPRKPNPLKVLNIAKAWNLAPAEIIYVGDSDVDMQTGVNAQMFTVGVLWGFRGAEELIRNGAQELVNYPAEIMHIIK